MKRSGLSLTVTALSMLWAGAIASAHASPLRSPERPNGIFTRASHLVAGRGSATIVSGSVKRGGRPLAGELVELQLQVSGRRAFVNVAHTLTTANGRYRFAPLRIYRDTRLRVEDVGRGLRKGRALEVEIEPGIFPIRSQVLAASHYLAGRDGIAAFALVDDRGRLTGVSVHRRFHSASVVKSMLLVAYLRMLAQHHLSLSRESQALLYPMIHSSDNEAASAVLAIVGESALDSVARDAHMSDYEPGGATWGFTEVSAADLARFFFHQDSLIPARFDGYARWLLSTIEPSESWGIPAVARPWFQVFFKGGWLPEVEGLVNQVGRLERRGVVFSLAVLSTHDPSMLYGEQTIEGVTARLIGGT